MANLDGINTLSKFGTKLSGQNQRVKFTHLETRYRVKFVGFGVAGEGDNLTLDMKEFDTPKGDFTTKTIELVNGQVKYPGEWKWSDVNFKVYNTYDNMGYKALFNQIQRQRNIYDQVIGDAPSNYKFTTIFEHVDGHQNTLSQWVLEGCFLIKAQTGSGKNNSYDAMVIDCSLSFDNATLYDKDGLQIPTADAGIITDVADALAF